MRKKRRESMALIALAVEAKRRGVSYGHLVKSITPGEREEIVRKYEGQAGKKGKQDT